jgi:hypothetical protein
MGATSSESGALILSGSIHKLVQSKRYLGTSKSQTILLEKSAVIFLFPTQAASKALSNNRINSDLRQRRFAPPAQARYVER